MATPRLIPLALAGLLMLGGCAYSVPITATPTRPVDPHLLGIWSHYDPEEQKVEQMTVRKFDESTYVVAIDHDIYRAFHSDVGNLSLVSVQDLNSDDRKYVYYAWSLSPDHRQLTLRRVRPEVIPDKIKDSVEIQQRLKEQAANPKLFDQDLVFTLKGRSRT